MALQLKFKPKTLRNPNFTKLFSSKSSNSNNDDNNNNRDKPQSPRLSPFSDIQSRLKQQQQSPPLRPTPNYPPSSLGSLEEIRKNLTDFRRKTSQNEIPPQQSHSQTISFEDLYKRNVLDKKNEETVGTNQSSGNDRFAFDKIRNSLRNMPDRGKNSGMGSFGGGFGKRTLDPYSLDSFKKNLNKVPDDPKSNTASTLIGESKPLPSSVFQKELEEKPEVVEFKTEFVKTYSYEELGEKLKLLRPTASNEGNKSWFSMVELNERLKRLREVEEAGNNPTIGGVNFRDLRETLNNLRQSNDEKNKKPQFQKVDIFSHLGLGKSNIMQGPPKEHLVEKYFHPDNMSSGEKVNLELKKVRDEFKMSESDSGSSRVQVAQLTTKIKHLSTTLHKKDKHSRKGLMEMIQQRKKLLKYLRRTDWDSYVLVLGKFGLKDNPDYKN